MPVPPASAVHGAPQTPSVALVARARLTGVRLLSFAGSGQAVSATTAEQRGAGGPRRVERVPAPGLLTGPYVPVGRPSSRPRASPPGTPIVESGAQTQAAPTLVAGEEAVEAAVDARWRGVWKLPAFASHADARLFKQRCKVRALLEALPPELLSGALGDGALEQVPDPARRRLLLARDVALEGRDVVHFIDNTSAVAALSKGYSGAPDSARLVHMFHAWQAGSRSNVWFEYVPTDANPADEPSRVASLAQDRYVVGDIVSEAVDLRFPPLGSLDHLHGWCVEAAAVRARM